jgi:hypothetical protein
MMTLKLLQERPAALRTLQVQMTLRPDPARPVQFRGSLADWWSTPYWQRAVLADTFRLAGEAGEAVPFEGRGVYVRLTGVADFDATRVEVWDADSGAALADQVWTDDYIDDLQIMGVECDEVTAGRVVREVRDDDPAVLTALQREAAHAAH